MTDFDSDVFHIAIERADRTYVTRVVASPAGRGEAPFVAPLHADDVIAFWRTMLAWQADAAAAWEAARTVGTALFHALLPEPLNELLYAAYRRTYQQQKPLALHLSLAEDLPFVTLPWEYLFDPMRREFPALSIHSPFVRYTHLMHRLRPLPISGPIRALVVVADPEGYPSIGGERRWLDLVDTLDYLAADGRLFVERLRKPTLHDFQRRLRAGDFQILHFIGHVMHDDQARDGRLLFEDEMGRGRPVSGHHLGQILRDSYDTRLVIFQACDETFDTLNPAGMAASHLIPRGVPATVALPIEFPLDLTLAFLHELYVSTLDHAPIGVAMARARAAMVAERNAPIWGMPWLLSRMTEGYLFDDGRLPKPDARLRPEQHRPSLLERVMRLEMENPVPGNTSSWPESDTDETP